MKSISKKLICAVMIVAVVATMAFALTACNPKDTRPIVNVGYTIAKPLNYTENGELVGFDTELATAVFDKLGYHAIFKEISWENKYVSLQTKEVDCIWNGFTSNSDEDGTPRSELVDFTNNYMINKQCVIINKKNATALTKVEDFDKKVGYIEDGSAAAPYMQLFEDKGAIKKTATLQMDAIMQVNSKSCDFAIVDYLLANSIIGKGNFSDLTIVDNLSSENEYYAVGFQKASKWVAKVNKAFEELAKDGTLQKIADKYELSNAVITDFSD